MSFSKVNDLIFNTETMKTIGNVIVSAYPAFNQKLFQNLVFDQTWKQRGLKDRMHHVSTVLNDVIDKPYNQTIQIILDANKTLSFNYTHIIFPDFVEQYGIEHFELSMLALKELTKSSTSEFAIRPFLRRYGPDAMNYLYKWSKDENDHVRRLSSEGCRPFLPLSINLPEFIKDPTPILPILEQLKYDDALYVQKSVSNNMNDISRNHPDIILKLCREWKQQQKLNGIMNLNFASIQRDQVNSNDKSAKVDFITTRACRTLLKQGNQEALEMFGVGEKEGIIVKNLVVLSENVEIGGQVDFEFELVDLRQFKKGEGVHDDQHQESNFVVESLREIVEDKNDNLQDLKDDTKTRGLKLSSKKSKAKAGKQQVKENQGESINIDPIYDNEPPQKSTATNTQFDSSFDSVSQHLLRVEYKINYLKSNGKYSSKIFMLRNNYKLNQGTSIKLKSSQRMQQLATRKHYPGQHYVEIMVNGISKAKTSFMLESQKQE